MLNFGPTFIWAILNLIILYFILKRVLFKPVTQFMENRTNSIKNDLSSVEKGMAEAAALKEQYEGMLKDSRIEADKIVKAAHDRASAEYDGIIKSARQEASDILENANEELERERQQMLKEIRNQIAGLALAAASKVLEANMNTESNKAIVDKFIDEEGAA
jgi:F-type H+-transporting ATPase subunit b